MITQMNMETPNYYAIIPATVRYDKNLTYFERIMYGEITALSNRFGYCFATNDYFSKSFNCSIFTVSRAVNNLQKNGYVSVDYSSLEGLTRRKIYVENIAKSATPKNTQFAENDASRLVKNRKYNTTSVNNTSVLLNPALAPQITQYQLPLIGKNPNARILSLYELLWQNKMGVECAKLHVPSKESSVISRLLLKHGEVWVALFIIIHFEWKGIKGDDAKVNRGCENAGYPIMWVSKNAPAYLAYLTNTLGIKKEEDAVKNVPKH